MIVYPLAESHIVLQIWPGEGATLLDIECCNIEQDNQQKVLLAAKKIQEHLKAKEVVEHELRRRFVRPPAEPNAA